MIRAFAISAALLVPFFFPVLFSSSIIVVAAFIVPPVAFASGLLYDVLYWSPSAGLPLATIFGLLVTVVTYFVHQFIKTRIIR